MTYYHIHSTLNLMLAAVGVGCVIGYFRSTDPIRRSLALLSIPFLTLYLGDWLRYLDGQEFFQLVGLKLSFLSILAFVLIFCRLTYAFLHKPLDRVFSLILALSLTLLPLVALTPLAYEGVRVVEATGIATPIGGPLRMPGIVLGFAAALYGFLLLWLGRNTRGVDARGLNWLLFIGGGGFVCLCLSFVVVPAAFDSELFSPTGKTLTLVFHCLFVWYAIRHAIDRPTEELIAQSLLRDAPFGIALLNPSEESILRANPEAKRLLADKRALRRVLTMWRGRSVKGVLELEGRELEFGLRALEKGREREGILATFCDQTESYHLSEALRETRQQLLELAREPSDGFSLEKIQIFEAAHSFLTQAYAANPTRHLRQGLSVLELSLQLLEKESPSAGEWSSSSSFQGLAEALQGRMKEHGLALELRSSHEGESYPISVDPDLLLSALQVLCVALNEVNKGSLLELSFRLLTARSLAVALEVILAPQGANEEWKGVENQPNTWVGFQLFLGTRILKGQKLQTRFESNGKDLRVRIVFPMEFERLAAMGDSLLRGEGESIAVVDADSDLRIHAVRLLRQLGYRVEDTASLGQLEGSYDLLVLGLDSQNTAEVLAKMELSPTLPVLALAKEQVEEIELSNPHITLVKPASIQQLAAAIRQLLSAAR